MIEFEAYSLFCEDIRWESNGAPMLLGIMSPVFHPFEYPVKFEKITLVTFFRASTAIEGFSAVLVISKIDGEDVEEVGSFGADYRKEDADDVGFQWVTVSHLPLGEIELSQDQSLVASLTVDEQTWKTYLTAGDLIETENK